MSRVEGVERDDHNGREVRGVAGVVRLLGCWVAKLLGSWG
jgi:hypothetical protein